jgi:hypothetical protein
MIYHVNIACSKEVTGICSSTVTPMIIACMKLTVRYVGKYLLLILYESSSCLYMLFCITNSTNIPDLAEGRKLLCLQIPTKDMKDAVYWDMRSCSVVDSCQRFGGTCVLACKWK